MERWRSNPSGPHISAPRALLERYPNINVIQLPVSRRLLQDTVKLIQPAFYPELPFQGLNDHNDRSLTVSKSRSGAKAAANATPAAVGRGAIAGRLRS